MEQVKYESPISYSLTAMIAACSAAGALPQLPHGCAQPVFTASISPARHRRAAPLADPIGVIYGGMEPINFVAEPEATILDRIVVRGELRISVARFRGGRK
jgi:hypothetical protein